MVNIKKGLCCGCQEIVPVTESRQVAEETSFDREWGFMGDEGRFVCISHTFYGEPCDGSGQVPQCLVEDSK